MIEHNPSRLSRRLNTTDAVIIGLGSMIGAGIFVAAGPAAAAAGSGLLIGVLIAGCLAYLNATSMAQLAGAYPEAGGTYVYGKKLLGPYWGFLAGWGFVVGKLASCTAMALTFAYYAAPEYTRPIAVTSVLTLTLINYLGVKKTATATKLLVALVLISLSIVVFASLAGGAAVPARLWDTSFENGPIGILQSAGLMFFAFAGYARVATLGEEVIEPKSTIPKAILVALAITVVVYTIVIGTAVLCVDIETLSQAKAPLVLAVESGRFAFLSPAVRIGACFASMGVLLSLLAGVSRTTFAMAANRDLPFALSAVHPTHHVPHRAEITVGLIVATIVGFADIRSAIGFSSFAVLTYYAIANASALALNNRLSLWPKWLAALGLVSCVTIALSLPRASVIGGIILFSLGTAYFLLNHRTKVIN
ncbi:amino acid permease [bacterium]|nr:amino acid permease [bacterium]